ncbi:MAG TPA: alpha/beta hydrolase-fold protein [Bryobacteraceae bacterium]
MRLNRFLPIAVILTFTAAIVIAQPPAGRGGRGPSGRGGFGRGPNFSGPHETISVAYPGTEAYTQSVEKLVAAVKAAKSKPSKKDAAALEEQIRAVLIPPPPATPPANPGPPPPDRLKTGSAAVGEHGEFVFAIEADRQPEIEITNIKTTLPRAKAWQAGKLWVYQTALKPGSAYAFTWFVDGKPVGGANDLPAFTEDAYPKPGVPQGKLTGPIEVTSKVYPNMKSNVWYYVPAQWDGSTPLPVQIWGDGQFYTIARPSAYRLLDTLDNLTAQKKIPLMVNVFIQPGSADGRNLRSVEYDTVDDRYTEFTVNEVLPEIEKAVKLRHDGYSRAMVGESSGGICSFNAAYRHPDEFARVLSWIGSFSALQVSPDNPTGGGVYPILVRREPKKNIRVWLQDGAHDQENVRAGSWIMQNIQLANSLKTKGYDYHFSLGPGTHSQRQGSAELPASLEWLWRDYDPAKTTQDFVQEPSETAQPLWRIVTMNRE